jgi:hypothetical protein
MIKLNNTGSKSSVMYELQNAIQEAQAEQYENAASAQEEQDAAQQRFGKIIGYESGTNAPICSEHGAGGLGMRSLTNASLPVGEIVSVFRENGSSTGFVDAIGSG